MERFEIVDDKWDAGNETLKIVMTHGYFAHVTKHGSIYLRSQASGPSVLCGRIGIERWHKFRFQQCSKQELFQIMLDMTSKLYRGYKKMEKKKTSAQTVGYYEVVHETDSTYWFG